MKWIKEKRAQAASLEGKEQITSLLQVEYKCQACIKCIACGAKEAGKTKNNKWSRDFNFCSNCNRKRKAKQYCQVC